MIDDGYTEEFECGIKFRRCLFEKVRSIAELATQGKYDEIELLLFDQSQSHVFVPSGVRITDTQKKDLFKLLVSYVNETPDWENLKSAAGLAFTDPMLFLRSCEICQRYWIDHEAGTIMMYGDSPVLRPRHAQLPCRAGVHCKRGHVDRNPLALSERNKKAWEHWLKWRHSGVGWYDPIVHRNWTFFGTMAERHGISRIHSGVD